MTALPVLYSFRRCPYAMRARLALAVGGVPVELREVALRSKPAELLSASTKGTVPVLVLPNGEVIDESLNVMLWALRQHDPEDWLQPSAGSLGDMLALIAQCDGQFKPNLDRYKYPNRYLLEAHAADLDSRGFARASRARGAAWLVTLQTRLTDRPALFGGCLSLADMAVLPFVRQFAHTDAAWFAAQPWPQMHAWLAQFEASTLFATVMQGRAPAWRPATSSL